MRTMQKKWMAQPLSGLGLRLAEEEHEQEDDDLHQLLVAQLKLYRQREHGNCLIQRWRRRQLVKVGIYKARCCALALGLPRMALSVGMVDSGCLFRGPINRTLSRVVARQLGLLTQVRCPARGSAWVTPMKPNVGHQGPEEASEAPLSTVPCMAWLEFFLLFNFRNESFDCVGLLKCTVHLIFG
jgi:hypothetical protein